MQDQWLYARSIAEIKQDREAMLACSLGTDIEYNDIIEELPEHKSCDEAKIAQHWFDWCVKNLQQTFLGGTATLYRAIAVEDIKAFIAATTDGANLGNCWTWDKYCASTRLHGGDWKPHDLLLTCTVSPDAIGWATTFQQHFAHPCEREVFIEGQVLLTSIENMETGRMLKWTPRMIDA